MKGWRITDALKSSNPSSPRRRAPNLKGSIFAAGKERIPIVVFHAANSESDSRWLEQQLGRKGITLNAVLSSFTLLGLNSAASNRAVLAETGKVPAGETLRARERRCYSAISAFTGGIVRDQASVPTYRRTALTL